MNQIKVSIIVPVYNSSSFIKGTMSMLCGSELKEIEIIAVDDGSKDQSLSVLEECAKEDDRIKVIHKENGGVFDARNYGLKNAAGEYICFCDQDDLVEPQMYEVMFHTAKQNNCEVVMCSTGKLLGSQEKIVDYALENYIFEGKDVISECFLPLVFFSEKKPRSRTGQKISNMIWKCMISKEFINENEIRFRQYVNYEDDRLFLLDVLARAKRVALISDALYFWKVNLSSESHEPGYIENLYEKDLELQKAITHIMEKANCENEIIEFFVEYNSAWRYSRIVENETNHIHVSLKQKLNIIKQIYEEENYKNSLGAITYYGNNMFARKVTCKFLEYRFPLFAYLFWDFYTFTRHHLQNRRFWVGLENKAMNS